MKHKVYLGWVAEFLPRLEGRCDYYDPRRGWYWPYSKRGQVFKTKAAAKAAVQERHDAGLVDISNFAFRRRFRWVS